MEDLKTTRAKFMGAWRARDRERKKKRTRVEVMGCGKIEQGVRWWRGGGEGRP